MPTPTSPSRVPTVAHYAPSRQQQASLPPEAAVGDLPRLREEAATLKNDLALLQTWIAVGHDEAAKDDLRRQHREKSANLSRLDAQVAAIQRTTEQPRATPGGHRRRAEGLDVFQGIFARPRATSAAPTAPLPPAPLPAPLTDRPWLRAQEADLMALRKHLEWTIDDLEQPAWERDARGNVIRHVGIPHEDYKAAARMRDELANLERIILDRDTAEERRRGTPAGLRAVRREGLFRIERAKGEPSPVYLLRMGT